MQVMYSYGVSNAKGTELEDEVVLGETFKDTESAVHSLEKSGYKKVDDKNYKKQLNDTLYHLATLVPTNQQK